MYETPLEENPVDRLDDLKVQELYKKSWIAPAPKKVGMDTVTVPAGTFECEHFRGKTETGAVADIWISSKVTPYGLVKMTTKDETIILQKVLENETSQIKYEPRKAP